MAFAPDVQFQVIAGGFDPVDLVDLQKENAPDGFDDEAFEIFFLGAQVGDQARQAFVQIAAVFALDDFARTAHGAVQALAVEGF